LPKILKTFEIKLSFWGFSEFGKILKTFEKIKFLGIFFIFFVFRVFA